MDDPRSLAQTTSMKQRYVNAGQYAPLSVRLRTLPSGPPPEDRGFMVHSCEQGLSLPLYWPEQYRGAKRLLAVYLHMALTPSEAVHQHSLTMLILCVLHTALDQETAAWSTSWSAAQEAAAARCMSMYLMDDQEEGRCRACAGKVRRVLPAAAAGQKPTQAPQNEEASAPGRLRRAAGEGALNRGLSSRGSLCPQPCSAVLPPSSCWP